MKKPRDFDNILDQCLEQVLVKDTTIEECLKSFPEHADELRPLLEMALAVQKASAIEPSPEFKDRARYQFYAALQETEHKKSRRLFGGSWQPRWAMVVTIVLVLLLASSGTVAAAGESMPDEPLYPVKLATEQVRLMVTPSALGKAELYAKFADRRVVEIDRMATEGKPEQIERTVRRLDKHLVQIAHLVSTQEVMGEVVPVPELEKAPLLPERAKVGPQAQIKVEPRARLRATVARHAMNHPQRLRALLRTAPESAKPALQKAIDVSESGYEKALESLD